MHPLLDLARFVVDVDDDAAFLFSLVRSRQGKDVDVALGHGPGDLDIDVRAGRALRQADAGHDVAVRIVLLFYIFGNFGVRQRHGDIFPVLVNKEARRDFAVQFQYGSYERNIGVVAGRRADAGDFRLRSGLRRQHGNQAQEHQERKYKKSLHHVYLSFAKIDLFIISHVAAG